MHAFFAFSWKKFSEAGLSSSKVFLSKDNQSNNLVQKRKVVLRSVSHTQITESDSDSDVCGLNSICCGVDENNIHIQMGVWEMSISLTTSMDDKNSLAQSVLSCNFRFNRQFKAEIHGYKEKN